MAGEAQNSTWPLPKFHFKVEFGGGPSASFQEVSGLDTEADISKYRHGNETVFSTVKIPKLRKSSHVTLKRGVFAAGKIVDKWFNKINLKTIERKTVTIMLLDELGETVMNWTLKNAFPIQIQGTVLDSGSNVVEIETLVLEHEGMTLSTPGQG